MNTEDMTANNARLETNRSANSRRPSRRGRSRGAMGPPGRRWDDGLADPAAALPSSQQARQRRAVTVPRPLTLSPGRSSDPPRLLPSTRSPTHTTSPPHATEAGCGWERFTASRPASAIPSRNVRERRSGPPALRCCGTRCGRSMSRATSSSWTEDLTQERPLSAFASRGGGVQVLSG